MNISEPSLFQQIKNIGKEIISKFCSFYILTLTYVICVSFIGGICLYLLEKDFSQIKFLDAFFIVVSSSTGCGLMTVDIYFLKTSSQFILTFCAEIGGVCFASAMIPAYLRWYRLSQKMKKMQKKKWEQSMMSSSEDSAIDVEIVSSEIIPYKYNYEIELKAVKYFAVVTTIYQFGLQFIGFVILALNCRINKKTYNALVNDGINPAFYALFVVVSGWNNVGSTITPSSFDVSEDPVVICVMVVMCVMGLIGIPIGLRFFIFILHRLFERKSNQITIKNPLLYILKSPTRISNFLFSATQTNVLILIFFFLVTVQTISIVLWNRDESLSKTIFLAIAQSSVTRTSGFTFINFGKLHDIVVIVICFTMFVGSYPIQIIRNYRDTQVGIESGYMKKKSNIETIIVYFKDIIFSHSMIVLLLTLLVMTVYGIEHPEEHTALTAIFEVVSGFGTVGYSMGCSKCDNFSFSGVLPPSGKLIIIFSMFIGRVRGYPNQLYPPDYYDNDDETKID